MALQLELPDKRILSYADFGDRDATKTAFYHHGFPSSHDEALAMGAVARELGIRLISPDRPGHGASTYQPNRRILDWPTDLLALADHLQVDRFVVLGISGGGPYALACCHQLPKSRCVGVGIVAGLFPPGLGLSGMLVTTRILFVVAQWSTWLVAALFDLFVGEMARDENRTEKLEKEIAKSFRSRPKPDRDAFDRSPELRQALLDGLKGAFQAGGQGSAWEAYLFGRDWGFDIKDLKAEPGKMVLWHGTEDVNVPFAMAEKASKIIPNAELRASEGGAHCSVIFDTIEDVLKTASNMLG